MTQDENLRLVDRLENKIVRMLERVLAEDSTQVTPEEYFNCVVKACCNLMEQRLSLRETA